MPGMETESVIILKIPCRCWIWPGQNPNSNFKDLRPDVLTPNPPGHTDKVFVVDVLKGKFDPEPESPTQNIEGSFSEGLFTMNDSNGMFF